MNKKFRTTASAIALLIFNSAAFSQTCKEEIPLTAPDERFVIGESIITDKKTGLIWQRCSFGQVFKPLSANDPCEGAATLLNWKEALDESSRFEGGNILDWRLPNLKELSSLVETACFEPAINESIFPTTDGTYWTSTPDLRGTGPLAWVVGFKFGGEGKSGKQLLMSVRFVAGGDVP